MMRNYSYTDEGKFLQNIGFYLMIFILYSCHFPKTEQKKIHEEGIFIEILGTIQDAGYPQLGCMKICCREQWKQVARSKKIISIGVVDLDNDESYLFEASPDIREQIQQLSSSLNSDEFSLPNAIFLTHAHIGHYSGLMFLGRESYNTKHQPIYCMPRMYEYLKENGPWHLLDSLQNIELRPLVDQKPLLLNDRLTVTPFLVPHRGEYSETVGYLIIGPNKKALFIPDIDKWSKWSYPIDSIIQEVDYALLDATFYSNGEIPGRDMSEIPHPFMEESFARFDRLEVSQRKKIYFIHFNHTNPIIDPRSEAFKKTIEKGYNICQERMKLSL